MTHPINAPAEIRVEEWLADASRAADIDAETGMLAEVLHAVVHAGAGVSFFTPFSIDEARAFWVDKVLPQVRAGTRRVLTARLDQRVRENGKAERVTGKGKERNVRSDRIIGTVQLESDPGGRVRCST